MKLTSSDLLKLGIIEKVIPETEKQEALEKDQIIANMKKEIDKKLSELVRVSKDELIRNRYNRFRQF